MKNKIIKRTSAVVLAAAMIVSAVVLPKVHAAIAVEPNRTCSMEINVANNDFSELSKIPVNVKIYKVADIDVTGAYMKVEAVKENEKLNLSDISSETTAEEWQEKAGLAKEAVTEAAMEPTMEVVLNGELDETGNIVNPGNIVVTGLETGMYLIDAQQALSDYYQYDFTPYLISLPNNYYYSTGDDTWVYDLTGTNAIGLKPEKTDRYGELVIEKELDVYNATNGSAAFVFKIEGTKTDIDTSETKVVYSDVVSMTFTEPGVKQLVIEHIPAGSNVTVTEVYTGASYKLTSDGSVDVTIIADGEEGSPVTAAFENTYDDRHNGGNGVVNSFIYNEEDGSWSHSAAADSIPEAE